MDKKIWNISVFHVSAWRIHLKYNETTISVNFIFLTEDSSLMGFLSFRNTSADYLLEMAEIE